MVDNPDVPVLNVIADGYVDMRRKREIERIVNRLKFIYVDRYNVISSYDGVSIAGDGVIRLIIGRDCNFNHILEVLDDRITKELDTKEEVLV